MSTRTWQGDASPIAQVTTLTCPNASAADVYSVAIGDKVLQVTVTGAMTTVDLVAAAIAAAWAALPSSTWPEFAQMTAAAVGSGGYLTVTANTPGVPFTLTLSKTGSGTFAQAATVANSGPNCWNTAKNWSGGAVPVASDDVVFENTNVPVLYDLDQHTVTLSSLTIKQSCETPFAIGLARLNPLGYFEYQPTYLTIGATTVSIGNGSGNGCGRIRLNTYTSAATSVTVYNSGTPAESGVPAVLLAGSYAGNALSVLKGSVGVGFFATDAARFDAVTVSYTSNPQGDANVYFGSQTVLATITQSGGQITLASNVTTLNQNGNQAVATIQGAATIGTLTANGTIIDQSTGTITTATIRGTYDASLLTAGKTITNVVTLAANAVFNDPFGHVTLSAGLQLSQWAMTTGPIIVPANKTFSWT